jgi:chemotaxis protein MotC
MTLAAAIAAAGPVRASEEAAHDAGHGQPPAKDGPAKEGAAQAVDEKQAARARCYEAMVSEEEGPAAPSPAEGGEHPPQDEPHAAEGGEPAAPALEASAHTQTAELEKAEAEGEAGSEAIAAPHPDAAPVQPAPGNAATSEPQQPYKLIRTLESLQDRIAAGSREAHTYQRELLSDIARKLAKVPDEDWRKPRNSRAGIVYALSGGDPGVLAKLLSLSPLPCIDDKLIKGLIDYSQARSEAAWKLLSGVDPHDLDPRAAGHLALAQAMLIAGVEPKKAMSYLDLARIIAPGTLVEEAALRREAVIAASIEDFQTFQMLTSQYLRRFSKSVYASDFMRRFAAAVTGSKYSESGALFQQLTEVLDKLDADMRQSAYLALARSGALRGRIPIALTAARKLAEFSSGDPKMQVRAKLYEGSAQLVTPEYDQAVALLKSIDRAALPVRERPVLDAALQLAERLRAPVRADLPAAEPPPVSAEQGKNAEMEKPRFIDDAKAALSKAEELIEGDRR